VQLATRLLSEESAKAVKAIRDILTSMEDHGIIDVFAKYPSQDVAASFYALYRLQHAACQYEQMLLDQDEVQQSSLNKEPKDLHHVLEDLSHYVVYATAAYGWKMDLAFKGKLHMGNEQALMRKTWISKDDIVHLSLKSKTHLPVFFLVRDRKRKALVLCVRGTWSVRDILTDLCCTSEEYESPVSPAFLLSVLAWKARPPQRYCAHHGMLEAAMTVAIEMEDVVQAELEALGPDYSLVLVGHSMGGGVVSLLATLWEERFKNMKTYLFGGPCVAPIDSHPTNNTNIINVISEGDPFRCLSLGHIADISSAVAHFCENPDLRRLVLSRSDEHLDEMCMSDLKFCHKTMERLRHDVMTNPNKMFPPGRLLHVNRSLKSSQKPNNDNVGIDDFVDKYVAVEETDNLVIHEVGPSFFRELMLSPRMLDLSRHLPSLYEDTLQNLMEQSPIVSQAMREKAVAD